MKVQCVTCCGLILKVSIISVCVRASVTVTPPPADIEGWALSPRGAGYLFGHDVVAEVSVSVAHVPSLTSTLCSSTTRTILTSSVVLISW